LPPFYPDLSLYNNLAGLEVDRAPLNCLTGLHLDLKELVGFEEDSMKSVLIAEEEVEKDLHNLIFNKWLMAMQCVLGPLFCAGVLCSEFPLIIYEGSLL